MDGYLVCGDERTLGYVRAHRAITPPHLYLTHTISTRLPRFLYPRYLTPPLPTTLLL